MHLCMCAFIYEDNVLTHFLVGSDVFVSLSLREREENFPKRKIGYQIF